MQVKQPSLCTYQHACSTGHHAHTHSIDSHFECVGAVCISENVWRQFASWRTLQMVCSSSLQPQANPNNSYAHLHIEVFALQSCVHGWLVATSRVCMGVVFGAVCTCGYVLHHYTSYHYTAIASITSLSSDVILPSALIHHCLV